MFRPAAGAKVPAAFLKHFFSIESLQEIQMRRRELLVIFLLMLSGCGGGLEQFPTAKVTGKVMCVGQPISGVLIIFAPVAAGKSTMVGKSGQGIANADGTFSVSTYGTDDGAVVGKHSVVVLPPHAEDFPDFTCACETNGKRVVAEFDVSASGENNFIINLPEKADKTIPNIAPEDLEDINAASEN